MEQIAKLLFATTVILIFSFLLFFSAMTRSGNGGEYWGYDGILEPEQAAKVAYENRDYRFLAVKLAVDPNTPRRLPQEYQVCENHPFGAANSLRWSSMEPMHYSESLYVATSFALQYNEAMMKSLAKQMGYRCEVNSDAVEAVP